MTQRIAAIGITIAAILLALFAFTQQQGAANNEATAIAKAYSAGTAQSGAEAAQETAIFQMDTHATAQAQAEAAQQTAVFLMNTQATAQAQAEAAQQTAVFLMNTQATAQAQAEATRDAAELSAQQAASTAGAANAGATQQAQNAATAQAGATQQAQVAIQAQAEATEQAATATVAEHKAIQLAGTAEKLQAEVTAQANQAATQQSAATAGAETAQAVQRQADQIVAHSTTAAGAIQSTLSALETQAAVPVAPQEVIQYLVKRKLIPENIGKLAARLGKTTINMAGKTNRSEWIYLPGSYADFVMSADISWGTGSSLDRCDFVLRHLGNDHYRIGINRHAQITFDVLQNNQWDTSEPYTSLVSLIRTAQSDTNTLLVVGLGNTFSVYINGQFAISYYHTEIAEGQLAIEAATDSVGLPGAGCTYQNTWIWNLTQPKTTPTIVPTAMPMPVPTASGAPFTVPVLTNQYTSKDHKLSFNYPLEWQINESSGAVIAYTKDFQSFSAAKIQSGQMALIISSSQVQGTTQNDLDFMLNVITGGLSKSLGNNIPVEFTEPESLDLPGRNIRRSIGRSESFDIQVWIYSDHGEIISIVPMCAPGEWRLCEPTALAIVKTITYNPTP